MLICLGLTETHQKNMEMMKAMPFDDREIANSEKHRESVLGMKKPDIAGLYCADDLLPKNEVF